MSAPKLQSHPLKNTSPKEKERRKEPVTRQNESSSSPRVRWEKLHWPFVIPFDADIYSTIERQIEDTDERWFKERDEFYSLTGLATDDLTEWNPDMPSMFDAWQAERKEEKDAWDALSADQRVPKKISNIQRRQIVAREEALDFNKNLDKQTALEMGLDPPPFKAVYQAESDESTKATSTGGLSPSPDSDSGQHNAAGFADIIAVHANGNSLVELSDNDQPDHTSSGSAGQTSDKAIDLIDDTAADSDRQNAHSNTPITHYSEIWEPDSPLSHAITTSYDPLLSSTSSYLLEPSSAATSSINGEDHISHTPHTQHIGAVPPTSTEYGTGEALTLPASSSFPTSISAQPTLDHAAFLQRNIPPLSAQPYSTSSPEPILDFNNGTSDLNGALYQLRDAPNSMVLPVQQIRGLPQQVQLHTHARQNSFEQQASMRRTMSNDHFGALPMNATAMQMPTPAASPPHHGLRRASFDSQQHGMQNSGTNGVSSHIVQEMQMDMSHPQPATARPRPDPCKVLWDALFLRPKKIQLVLSAYNVPKEQVPVVKYRLDRCREQTQRLFHVNIAHSNDPNHRKLWANKLYQQRAEKHILPLILQQLGYTPPMNRFQPGQPMQPLQQNQHVQPMAMPSVEILQTSATQSTSRGQGIPTYFSNNLSSTPKQNTVGLGINTSNGFRTGIRMPSSSPIPATHGAPTAPMYSTAPMNVANTRTFQQQSPPPSAQRSSESSPRITHSGFKRSASEMSSGGESSSSLGKRMKRDSNDRRNGSALSFE